MKKFLYILLIGFVLIPVYSQSLNVGNISTYGRDRWVPFMTSNTVFNVSNTLSEVTAVSFTIPGGCMGPNGALHITTLMSTSTSNTNAKTMIFHYGGVVLKRPTMSTITSNKGTLDFYLFNRGVENSQISIPSGTGVNSWSVFTAVPATFTIDTSVDQTFSIGLSNAVITDSINLEQFSLRVLKKP